jgi:hypothetical protein
LYGFLGFFGFGITFAFFLGVGLVISGDSPVSRSFLFPSADAEGPGAADVLAPAEGSAIVKTMGFFSRGLLEKNGIEMGGSVLVMPLPNHYLHACAACPTLQRGNFPLRLPKIAIKDQE